MQPAAARPAPSSESDREHRRRQLLAALREHADAILDRMADELVDLPDDKAFGAIEHTLRDLGHELAAHAHQAGLDAGKKRGTRGRASSARTVSPTPASSVTGARPS